MEILVLNTKLEAVAILDNFESLIWTERYYGYGDFEIFTQATTEFFNVMMEDYYLWVSGSDHVMIIEDLAIKSDLENGNRLIVTGRSIESIIDRRIIWEQTVLTGNFQNGIKQLLDENVISPTDPDRKIENFLFEASTDPIITALTIDAQFTRDNLYTSIQNLCSAKNIAFRVTLSAANKFVFKLYSGTDRSYSQFANPYVIFSPKFENLLNSNYKQSKKGLRTVTIVAGAAEGSNRKTTIVGSGVDLERRELYTDASSTSQNVGRVRSTDEEFLVQLTQKGTEALSGSNITQAFDGEVDNNGMFKYGIDFFMGDVVQIASEYGMTSKSRVTELIRSQSTEGESIIPTFDMADTVQVESNGVLNPGVPDTGATTGSGTYIYTQLASSTIWNITHNLDKRPSVTIVDSAGSLVVGDVNYIDDSSLTIKFTSSFSGSAYLN